MNLTYFSKCHLHSNQCEDHQSRNTIESPLQYHRLLSVAHIKRLKYMQPVLNKWKSSTNSILFCYYKEHPHCGNDLLRR
ncbi:hypothetical protein T08_15602, partial [Trichinella sp. T8]